jgi:uncharacterized membrane protein YfcA
MYSKHVIKHALFLKWWLIVALIAVGAFFAYEFGMVEEIYNKDFTKISFIILVGFTGASIQCGVRTFKSSSIINELKSKFPSIYPSEQREHKELTDKIIGIDNIGWFIAGTFTSLGLIGTVIGMIFALQGFVGVDVSSAANTQLLISKLVLGVSTALYTTLVGLVCSTLLKVQYFNLSNALKKVEHERV